MILRIADGDEPLDASSVHPEAYPVVERIPAGSGRQVKQIVGDTAFLRSVKAEQYTDEKFGVPTIRDILKELEKPGRDPRPEFKAALADGVAVDQGPARGHDPGGRGQQREPPSAPMSTSACTRTA